jgi:hypothetical protein
MQQQLSLSMKDLRFVAVACGRCGTRLVLDMASEYNPGREGFTPAACPTCGDHFPETVKPALDQFKRVYTLLAGLGETVTFSVNEAEGE